MEINISDLIIKFLEEHGVEHVFGMPGYQNLKLYDSMIDSKIKSVLVTSESFAVFMAEGYNLSSGKVSACVSIPGPGFTNMFTGLADAFVSSTPLLVLVVKGREGEKDFCIHSIKQLEAVSPIVKGVYRIDSKENVLKVMNDAFLKMREGEPGPVVVEVQESILKKDCEFMGFPSGKVKDEAVLYENKILEAVKILSGSEFCGIYFGKGAFMASEELIELAELISAPMASTVSGKGIVPEDHPLSVGFGFGPSGTECAEEIFRKCDCLLAVGCKFSEMATGRWGFNMPRKVIHIDINPDVIGRNYKADLSICADARIALREILRHKNDIVKRDFASLEKDIKEIKHRNIENIKKILNDDFVHLPRFFLELRRQMKRDAVLSVDCGFYQLWAINNFEAYSKGSFLSSSDYQTMGFGIGSAIGAKLADRSRDVVCVCGDGGFLMSGLEALTSKKEGLSIKFIVLNDGELGIIRHIQKNTYSRSDSVKLLDPDFELFARSLKMKYHRIKSDTELSKGLEEAFLSEDSAIIEVNIRYEDGPRYFKGIKKTIWKGLSADEKIRLSRNFSSD